MKTITLNRYPIFGRSGFMVYALHGRNPVHPHTHCQKLETLEKLLAFARREGFTHARFTGDWSGVTVRKSLQLHKGDEWRAAQILAGDASQPDFDTLAAAMGLDPSFQWTPETLAPYVRAYRRITKTGGAT